MVFRPSGRDHDSPNQLFLILETPRCSKQFKKKSEVFSGKYDFGKYQNIGTPNMCLEGKIPEPENPEVPFNKLSKILNMGAIPSRKHEMEFS